MPTIQLIKLTIRTGTEAQRRKVLLAQGELAYITDLKRMVVGDGLLSGGNPIGTVIHNPLQTIGSRITLVNAYKGDIVDEAGFMWQLTATDPTNIDSWANISSRIDNNTIKYNGSNELYLGDNSIQGNKFAAAAGSGGIKATLSNGLSAHPDYVTLGINANSEIEVLDGGISEDEINSTALGNGLIGGSGTVIGVDADISQFGFVGTTLSLTALPPNSVGYLEINPSVVGTGLVYDSLSQSIIANLSGVDGTINQNSGIVGLRPIVAGGTVPLATLTYDIYGRTIDAQSSIVTTFTLSATPTTPGYPWLSAYNGYPGQVTNGSLSGVPLTIFSVISSYGGNSAFIELSSAGFIALPYTTAVDGKTNDRLAVPVFTY